MGGSLMFGQKSARKTPLQKLSEINWAVVLILTAIALVGTAMLYSVAGGNFDPWASRHISRFSLALVAMIVIIILVVLGPATGNLFSNIVSNI